MEFIWGEKLKKLLVLICFSIFFLSLVSAVPPVTTNQQFTEGFKLEVPQDNILTKGDPYTFNFHVFNISNGLLIESGISCHFHLYGHSGIELADIYQNTVDDGAYSFTINEFNLTGGNVYYNVHCNNSVLEGYSSNIIEVTLGGDKTPDGVTLVFFMIFSLGMFLALIWSLFQILADLTQMQTNIKTVFLGFGVYMLNVAYYFFLTNFMPWELMLDISFLGLSAFGITHLFIPLVGLIFTWIKKGRIE